MDIPDEAIPPDEIDERSSEIDYQLRWLGERITDAQIALRKAQYAHKCLIALYDVEYAEDGGLLASFLADADKALYVAALIVEKRNG